MLLVTGRSILWNERYFGSLPSAAMGNRGINLFRGMTSELRVMVRLGQSPLAGMGGGMWRALKRGHVLPFQGSVSFLGMRVIVQFLQ